MAEAVQMLEWDQTSVLWATLANANRDEKKRPQPFMPTDIHPLRKPSDEDAAKVAEPDWHTINSIKAQYKTTKLNVCKSDQSRGGVS